ncbi:MAG: hypothetical protein N4A74_16895 [Carboxylicivirga sp.]|jgi:hypothetical protein|nr:hypothetical protein [Carboxylicivirga sp.]
MNKQLEVRCIMVKEGAVLVDASITNTPGRLKEKTKYDIAEDRKKDKQVKSPNKKKANKSSWLSKSSLV